MCEEGSKLVFCTCVDGANNQIKTLDGYVWTLNRFIKTKTYKPGEPRIMGKIMRQTEDLGNEINLDKIISELNSRNCFDFDYQPEEMDCLRISNKNPGYSYFTVLFKDGHWKHGAHPAFSTISENISKGKIKK